MRPMTARCLALALACAAGAPAFADNSFEPIAGAPGTYNLEFEGGPLKSYLEMLQETMRGKAAFVIPQGASSVLLPELSMENVTFASAVELVPMLTSASYEFVPETEVDNYFYHESEEEPAPVLVFRAPDSNAPRYARTMIASLEFPGGTIGSYVEALKAAGAEGKIALTGDPDALRIEKVSLKDVTLEAATRLVDDIRQSKPNSEAIAEVDDHDGLYMVHVRTARRSIGTESRVWSLRQSIGLGMDADTMLSAIEAGVAMTDGVANAEISFHEPTSLLIVVGERPALELIDSILLGLDRSARDASATSSPLDTMRQVLGMLQRSTERTAQRIDGARARMIEAQQRADELRVEFAGSGKEVGSREWMEFDLAQGRAVARATEMELLLNDLTQRLEGIEMRRLQLSVLIEEVEAGEAQPLSFEILMSEFGQAADSE